MNATLKQSKLRKKCRRMTKLRKNKVDEKVQCFTAKSESLHQAFGTSEKSIDKLIRRIGTIKNANLWESFAATLGGINAGNRAGPKSSRSVNCRVSQERRSDTGSKHLASGTPALGTKRANKLPRNLELCD
jgi:hypothetical protein